MTRIITYEDFVLDDDVLSGGAGAKRSKLIRGINFSKASTRLARVGDGKSMIANDNQAQRKCAA